MAGLHRAPTRTGRRWTTIAVALSGAAGALATAPAASGDPIAIGLTKTVVTPDNAESNGFSEPGTRPPGEVEFTEEFGDPSSATDGALALTTPDGSSKATFFTTAKNGPLSDFLGRASYATYRSSESTGADFQYPSYQITVDRNGGALEAGDFATLFYEPVYNSTAAERENDTWQTWDVAAGTLCSTKPIGGYAADETFCSNGGQRTLDEIVDANQGATVLAFGLNQGSGNGGIIAAADDLEGAGTTYDFELREPPVVIPDPLPDPQPDPDVDPPKPDDTRTDGDKDEHGDEDEHGDKDEHKDKDKDQHRDEHHDWSDPGKGDEDGHEHGDCTCP